MFGFVSKKKLLRIIEKLNAYNSTDKACGVKDFYFRCGVYNATDYICHKLNICGARMDGGADNETD